MQLAARQLTWPSVLPARRRARVARPAPVVQAPIELTMVQLARRAGGPQDRAFYTCDCGFAWTGNVSTTVGCPHCGTEQAW